MLNNAYNISNTLRTLALSVMKEHHPLVHKLVDDHKQYELFVYTIDEPRKSKGQTVLADITIWKDEKAWLFHNAPKSTGLQVATNPDVPVVAIRVYSLIASNAEEPQLRALMDHELCHLTVALDKDQEPFLKLVGHDVEEFADVAKRHGAWSVGLQKLAKSLAETDASPKLFDLGEVG